MPSPPKKNPPKLDLRLIIDGGSGGTGTVHPVLPSTVRLNVMVLAQRGHSRSDEVARADDLRVFFEKEADSVVITSIIGPG